MIRIARIFIFKGQALIELWPFRGSTEFSKSIFLHDIKIVIMIIMIIMIIIIIMIIMIIINNRLSNDPK